MVAAAVVVIALVAPAIDRSKDREAAASARASEAATAAFKVRLAAEQRAHRGRAPQVARLYAAGAARRASSRCCPPRG